MLNFFLTQAQKCDIINLLCWCFEKSLRNFKNPIDKSERMCYNIIRWRKSADKKNMGAFPSGQRGQTVNLLSLTSVVRIHPLPPTKKVLRKKCLFCWWNRMARGARTRGSLRHFLIAGSISLAGQAARGLVCGHESTRSHQQKRYFVRSVCDRAVYPY